jgi:hypothetical protein
MRKTWSGKMVGTAVDNLQESGLGINASESDEYCKYHPI